MTKDINELSKYIYQKPPLKWAGGKRWIIPYINPIWERYSNHRLVEPFCGGLAISLALLPRQALLNDINPHLINFYLWIKKGLDVNISMKNDSEIFYKYRELFNSLIKQKKSKTKKAAELFYYLNRTCYNGLCRFNSKGKFNVPFGRYKVINYKKDFFIYKKDFSKWLFSAKDFEKIKIKKNDFIYIDPPYDVEFTNYSKEGFSWKDQIRLVQWLSKQNCPIVVSNQATQRIVQLYKKYGFKVKTIDAPRMISCTGNRKKAKEIIAMKNLSLIPTNI